MPTPDQLANLGPDLLASLTALLPTLGAPVPERRYVHAGEVAYDCEQLVVALERVVPGTPTREQQEWRPLGGAAGRTAQLAVHLVRCVPTMSDRGNPPRVADLDALATQQYVDSLALPIAARTGWKDGAWGSTCDAIYWAETVPNGPLGGYCAIILRLLVQV